MAKFTREDDELLIRIIKSYRIMYDANDAEYRNNILKHRVWENVSNTIGHSIAECKKRWKSLRDHYQKKKKADQNGTGQSINWEYMIPLSFLSEPSAEASDAITNIPILEKAVDIEYSEDECVGDCKSPAPAPKLTSVDTSRSHYIKRKTIGTLRNRGQSAGQLLERILEAHRSTHPIKKFFDSMGDIVAAFPPHLAAATRLRVCEIITEMELRVHSCNESAIQHIL